MARKKQGKPKGRLKTAGRAELLADQAVALAEYAAQALVAAEGLRIKTRPVDGLVLHESERAALTVLPTLAAKVENKLKKPDAEFTVAEVAGVTMAVAEALPEASPERQVGLLLAAKKLMDSLQKNVVMPATPAKGGKAKSAGRVYQLKITLLDTRPPIWRRIQVEDCTLDKLHEQIQTAMGWTNSHLHHFRIGEQLYGDPDLMQENFEEMEYKDSTTTRISDLLPKGGKTFRFEYEYDFGDSWRHEVLFEAVVRSEGEKPYPVCLEGARACPPEDVGGAWGYAEFLEAMADPSHERHEELREWVGGDFDPEAFDPAAATREMHRGLPDWRRMSGW